jgi:hypothetical protein
LQEVERFKYLGRVMAANNSDIAAVKEQLHKARGSYFAMKKNILAKTSSPRLKILVFDVILEAQVLYGCQSWNITRSVANLLNSFQQQVLRHILQMHPKVVTQQGGSKELRYPRAQAVLDAAKRRPLADIACERQQHFALQLGSWSKASMFRHSCESVVYNGPWSSLAPLAKTLLKYSTPRRGDGGAPKALSNNHQKS